MNKLITYIYILRPINILICLISILICTYLISALSSPILPYAILTVLCFTGASNILNDIFDYNIDKINKPDKVKLYDISDDLRYLKHDNHTYRHLQERLKIYNKERFESTSIQIQI